MIKMKILGKDCGIFPSSVFYILIMFLTYDLDCNQNGIDKLAVEAQSLANSTTESSSDNREGDITFRTPSEIDYHDEDGEKIVMLNEPYPDVNNETDNSTVNETSDIDEGNIASTTEASEMTTLAPLTEPSPTTPPAVVMETEFAPADFCLCDLKIGFCDVNCCCDEDCSADDRQVFSHCQERPQNIIDSRYCYQQQIVFINNTEYTVEYTEQGAFCIVTDNLPQRNAYVTVKGAETIDEYNELEKNRRHYSWIQKDQSIQFFEVPYVAGAPIWGVNENGSMFIIGVPDSVIGKECEVVTPLHFLADTSASCNRVFFDLFTQCHSMEELSAQKHLSFLVVAGGSGLDQEVTTEVPSEVESPVPTTTGGTVDLEASIETDSADTESLNRFNHERRIVKLGDIKDFGLNESILVDTTGEEAWEFGNYNISQILFLPVETFLCRQENDSEHCTVKDLSLFPVPEYGYNACENVVLRIHFIFIHNGTEGINTVQAKVFLTNVTEEMTTLTQTFTAEFVWQSSKDDLIFERSGRPGYLVGKPLLLGKLIRNTSEIGEVREAIALDAAAKSLTVLTAGQGGNCDMRSPVTFGEDLRSGCIIRITQEDLLNCKALQQKFLSLLLGSALQDISHVRIASFGDSSVTNAADWVPILVPEEPRAEAFSSNILGKATCFELILSMHIEVAFSRQGALSNPQDKVVGIVLRYGEPQNVQLSCGSQACQTGLYHNMALPVELVSSVSFVDITLPPQPAYAQPPTLDVKLPYDFFYPFLPSVASAVYCYRCVAFLLCCIAHVYRMSF